MKKRTYLCIDMKSFYASVECAERDLNPFETNLVVSDVTRGKNALCLAISPKMKALGIKNRCRISDIPAGVEYIAAKPRMQLYVDYAADIYQIYLDYFSSSDIYVYSIDESFIDVTDYLSLYETDGIGLAKTLMNEIALRLMIPSTAGVGTNLYLAKVALDITAKHAGDHIGYLDEESYRRELWDHRPITDFWQIARGTAGRLMRYGITTMRGVANAPEDFLYGIFGINAELLIDHAWGREPCLISDIKNYRSRTRSVSFSQILPRDYSFDGARTVMNEMIYNGCLEMMRRHVITKNIWIGVGYSGFDGAMSKGSVRIGNASSLYSKISGPVLSLYDRTAVRDSKIRRLAISFNNVCDENCGGYDLFTDWHSADREKAREKAALEIAEKFGKNALLRGTNYLEGATQRERNGMIGGHRAGYDDERRKG